MLAAVKSGEAQILTKEKLLTRLAASKKVPATVAALRIPAADLALARKQAEQKGRPYQTYIKSLLHETLAEREKPKPGSETPYIPREFNTALLVVVTKKNTPPTCHADTCSKLTRGGATFAYAGDGVTGPNDHSFISDTEITIDNTN